MDQDILYHLALGSGSHDLQEMFGDVKVTFFFIFNFVFNYIRSVEAKANGSYRLKHNIIN